MKTDPDLIRRALAATPPGLLNPFSCPTPGLRQASVLVLFAPLPAAQEGCGVLLTERSAKLAMHAGQISFPGGRRDPEDADGLATALREAREEVGLACNGVDLLGRADDQVTGTGFLIETYVAATRRPPLLTPDPREVERILWLPLGDLLGPHDPGRIQWHHNGETLSSPAFPIETGAGEAVVWGATASILAALRKRLLAVAG